MTFWAFPDSLGSCVPAPSANIPRQRTLLGHQTCSAPAYRNVIYGGLIAGFGGAYFTVGSAGSFDENMTAGRGFIGLAAMIAGRWHPVGALGAALVFGFADAPFSPSWPS